MPLKIGYRLQTTVTKVNLSWNCNVCGKEGDCDGHPKYRPTGFHLIEMQGGYADDFPQDSDTLQIVVCEDCLKKWVGTFHDPDVIQSGWMYNVLKVRHSETGKWMQALPGHWLWPEGQEVPEDVLAFDCDGEDWPFPEDKVIWQHFKGEHYTTVGSAFTHPDETPMVIYRALYGDSELWARPAAMWADHIERGDYSGPRFKRIGKIPHS